MLERMHGSSFDWLSWSAGCIHDFGIPCRTESILANADILRKYAVGWCPGEQVVCRPKVDEIAVMFVVEDRGFWFHMRKHEFEGVFK